MNNELIEKERKAIECLRTFQPSDEPYYLCYSGGKDSDCIRILAQLADVKCDIVHNMTTVDAPETIKYVKSIPNVIIDKAHYPDGSPKTMWNLIVKKGLPPTKIMRYCCSDFKEHGGKGRLKITGVRKAESARRKQNGGLVKIIGKPKTVQKTAEKIGADYEITQQGGLVMNMDNSENRRLVEHCYRTTSTMINPIIDWTDADVWEFLNHYGCKSNPLYQCGKTRIGCIGCPLAAKKQRLLDFKMYPKYYDTYIRTFERMLKNRKESGMPALKFDMRTGEEVMKWWLEENPFQLSFFDN